MALVRRAIAVAVFAMIGSGLLIQPAGALHGDAVADCGSAGTFTLRTTPNGAGFESPAWGNVLLFEGGGTLAPLVVSRDGQVLWDDAARGLARNAVEEVTCSFTLANGAQVVATGIFTRR